MKSEKKLEEFTKKIIKEAGVEAPSDAFLTNVMQSIAVKGKPVVNFVYKPLISKMGWLIITLILMLLSVYISTSNVQSSSILSSLDTSFFNKFYEINFVKNLKFSTIFTFSMLLFTVFVVLQIIFIKNYYKKSHNL